MIRLSFIFLACACTLACKQQLGPGTVALEFGEHHLQVTVPMKLLEIVQYKALTPPLFDGVSLGAREFNTIHITHNRQRETWHAPYQVTELPDGKQYQTEALGKNGPVYHLWVERTLNANTYQCEGLSLSDASLAIVKQICLSLRVRT